MCQANEMWYTSYDRCTQWVCRVHTFHHTHTFRFILQNLQYNLGCCNDCTTRWCEHVPTRWLNQFLAVQGDQVIPTFLGLWVSSDLGWFTSTASPSKPTDLPDQRGACCKVQKWWNGDPPPKKLFFYTNSGFSTHAMCCQTKLVVLVEDPTSVIAFQFQH